MENRFNILVATDYSETASNAASYAVKLAESTKARLVFIHIYQIPFNSPSEPVEFAQSAEELYRSEMMRLRQHCDNLFNGLAINAEPFQCEYILREGGNVGKQITREAEESHADFIIVGTHGVSGFRKLFFGSHSWSVIKKSKIPVFAIPQTAAFSGVKNIVFGTEYREGEMAALNFLVHLAGILDAEVTVLHITNYLLTKKFEDEMFARLRNEVESTIAYPKLNIRLMVHENISEGVRKYCVENKTDLLVMSPEKPLLFENIFITNMSMTRKTILHTHIPLLAIPDFYNPVMAESSQPTETVAVDSKRK